MARRRAACEKPAMSDPGPDPTFADVFPRADEARWRALAEAALKGRPFSTLVSRAADGFDIQPLYARLADERPRHWRAETAWRVCARVDHPDPVMANALLRADLDGGANAIHLVLADAVGAWAGGLPAGAEAIAAALDGAPFEARPPIELDLGPASVAAMETIAAMIEARHIDPASYPISFGLDPFGWAARAGGADADWPELSARLAGRAGVLAKRGWRGRFALADGRVVNAAGGSPGQELAFVLAAAVAWLRAFEAAGVAIEDARAMIGFRLAADADEIAGVARFRALRRLWARVEQACGLAPAPIHLHAETSWRMMTRRDPWVNVLRGTVAIFSAGVGGADAITALPHTMALGVPDAFARRLARNAQLVLLEESNLARVVDPAAGAGGFEAMTDALATRAWDLFQEIERAGGLFASLASGAVQARVAEARGRRQADIARRKAPITGVSAYPDPRETAPAAAHETEPPRAAPAIPFPALPSVRDAAPFEALRDEADRRAAAGARPRVFLANLGPLAAHGARAAFARGLFEAAGFEAIDEGGFEDDDALGRAFAGSGATIACLCSSDALYAARASTAARALKSAGARAIWLAGRADEHEASWREAGVTDFVHAGSDAVAVLTQALAAA